MQRRNFTAGLAAGSLAGIGLGLGLAPAVHAEDWPNKPIRLIAIYSAGSSVDLIARVLSVPLSEQLGQQVIVDNRPGAGGDLGTDLMVKAPRDGYTLGFAAPAPLTVNPVLRKKMPFDVARDIAPVTLIATAPNILLTSPEVPAKNLRELIAYAKANPGKLSYGSAGFGTSGHLAGELFVYLTKTDITHVPYKGNSEAVTDLLGGRIQMMFSGPPPVLAFVAAGKLRAIAAADYKRSAALPDVPTMAEQGLADAESPAWYGMMAPAGVPAPILDRLNAEVHKAIARPEIQAKFAQLGINAQPGSRTEFRQMITDETAKWKKLFAGRDITID